jgi:hypothetical protein
MCGDRPSRIVLRARVVDFSFAILCGALTPMAHPGGTRELLWFDVRNPSAAAGSYTVDTGSGTLLPLFDADTGMMVMPSKGDGSIRSQRSSACACYHFIPSLYQDLANVFPPFSHRLLEWCNDALVQVQMETLAEPHIGFAMLPKRMVNVKTCELLRCARVTPDFIHTVSVGAARARLDLFQDDLYPPPFLTNRNSVLKWIIVQVPTVHHGPAERQYATVRFWGVYPRDSQDVAAAGGDAGVGLSSLLHVEF